MTGVRHAAKARKAGVRRRRSLTMYVPFGGFPRAEGEEYFEQMLAQRAGQRVTGNPSGGLPAYEDAQAADHPQWESVPAWNGLFHAGTGLAQTQS